MGTFNIVMPKMGESVLEATITKWFKEEGDVIEEDDVLLEIATDKVDSEIPSPVAGKIIKIHYKVDDLVPVGEIVAIIDIGGDVTVSAAKEEVVKEESTKKAPENGIRKYRVQNR